MELLIVILRVRGLILGQPVEQTLGVGIGHAACVGQGAHHGADVTAVERLQMRLADRAAVGQAADLVAARLQAQSAAMTCSSLRESCSMMNSFYNM